jgi:nucleoside phosphorylase
MNGAIERILILMAMQSEAEPLINALSLFSIDDALDRNLPFKAYHRGYRQPEIMLVISGTDERYEVDNIGPQAATLMAYIAINRFQPDLVISAGTAGGFRAKGAEIGTVYLSDREFIFHDRIVPFLASTCLRSAIIPPTIFDLWRKI